MGQFEDLNELITVAKQINEGKYNIVDLKVAPESELFDIAKFFITSLNTLSEADAVFEREMSELSSFESSFLVIIKQFKGISEDILKYLDKLNPLLDQFTEDINKLEHSFSEGNRKVLLDTLQGLSHLCTSCLEISFDILSSLEYQDGAKDKMTSILNAIDNFENQTGKLMLSLGIEQNLVSVEMIDSINEPKEILQDQSLVNKLLQEFGL